ncbi:hypothetical protein BY996DRAFT_4592174, partial [Phakopsora pachyrhizi]
KKHLMLNKSNQNKRDLKSMDMISSRTQTRLLRRLLPYFGKRAGFGRINIRECVQFKSAVCFKEIYTGKTLQLEILSSKALC